MSRVKDEYQKQMAAFCEKNNTISAQDILSRAKNQPPTEEKEKVVEFKPRKSKGMVWKAAIPAVLCFLLVGTTTLAATGQLTNIFRAIFKDEKTAEIVDMGYYAEINEKLEDDLFEVRILGVSGDTENPMLALDIYVKDTELVKNRDKIHIEAYSLGKEQYENELVNYGTWEAYGERDAEIENLYHINLRTGWLATGKEVVFEIIKIQLGGQKIAWESFDVSLKQILQVDTSEFYPVEQAYMDFKPFECGDRTYDLVWVLCGYYNTEVIFRNMNPEQRTSEQASNIEPTWDEIAAWNEFIKDVVLVVDGVEYKAKTGETAQPWYEKSEGGFYHMHPMFPGFDYSTVTSVEVRWKDTVYKVK
mgnify:CR=1 FL=1